MKLSKGYFLIELSIVIALLLLISTIAIPTLNFLKQQMISSDLEKMNVAFSYMRQMAVTGNKNLNLTFNNLNSYTFDKQAEHLSNDVKFGFIDGIKGPPSSPTKQVSSPISYVNNQVVFYSNGKIQPGTIYLVDSKKNYQYALTTPISQVSFIRKYKLVNGKWSMIS